MDGKTYKIINRACKRFITGLPNIHFTVDGTKFHIVRTYDEVWLLVQNGNLSRPPTQVVIDSGKSIDARKIWDAVKLLKVKSIIDDE